MIRNSILFLSLVLAVFPLSSQVKPGIEALRESGFDLLKGKRIALITNPTGVDSQFRSSADILAEAPDVELVRLFAPEHGIRGAVAAGAHVANTKDEKTGVPVASLYGKIRKPSPEMLRGLDAIVYDIQDNGCRSYTFISTMGKAMEAAAEAGLEFIVLDRPNPLGGNRVEGPLTEPDCISFVSQYPIPYLYGLTPGELAMYLKGEGLVHDADRLKLTVVPMEGWSRSMNYAQTRLPWVLPSPHIPSAETCLFYPATGIVGELDFLSIGVGYTLPFKTFAAPWIDADALADRLNSANIPGVAFRPAHYTPYYGKFKGEMVHGVEVYLTDPDKASLTSIQFYLLQALHQLYPDRDGLRDNGANGRNLRMFDQVVGSKSIRKKLLESEYNAQEVLSLWNKDAADFRLRSAPYFIYQ